MCKREISWLCLWRCRALSRLQAATRARMRSARRSSGRMGRAAPNRTARGGGTQNRVQHHSGPCSVLAHGEGRREGRAVMPIALGCFNDYTQSLSDGHSFLPRCRSSRRGASWRMQANSSRGSISRVSMWSAFSDPDAPSEVLTLVGFLAPVLALAPAFDLTQPEVFTQLHRCSGRREYSALCCGRAIPSWTAGPGTTVARRMAPVAAARARRKPTAGGVADLAV